MAARSMSSSLLRLCSGTAAARPILSSASRAFQTSTACPISSPGPKAQGTHDAVPTTESRVSQPGPPRGSSQQQLSLGDRLLLQFRDYMPNTTETYVAFDMTRELYNECAAQAAYTEGTELSEAARFWYQTCKRQRSFSSWAQTTILHMWMLNVRMRALEREKVAIWQQHFIDHFFYDSEEKMLKKYDVRGATKRSGYMKDLYHQYRGMTAAFDEGLAKGDAVLATAIWRNIFDADQNVDLELLAVVTSHVRRVISKLDRVHDDVILKAKVTFGLPLEERALVQKKSDYLARKLEKEPEVLTKELEV